MSMARTQPRLSRRESKEITRKRLVDGAIEILRRDGVVATTTGRIAEAAGIAQSSFYGHFADRDECLAAAADKIGGYVLHKAREAKEHITPGDLRNSIHNVYASVLDAFLSAPELTRIFLRHRDDDSSALGRAFRTLIDRARTDLKADFQRYELSSRPGSEVDVYADLLIGATLGAVEGLLSGRIDDREIVLGALTDSTYATVSTLLTTKVDP